MPNVSESSLTEINSLSSGEAFLALLTITHDGGTTQIVNNNETVVSNGRTFDPYGFDIILATQDGESLPTVQISVDNIDRALIDIIRQNQTAPEVLLEVVPASSPNVVEISIPDLALRGVDYTATTITGTLYVGDIMNQRFPADNMNPQEYQGLF